ncbi:MAG: ATP-binding protein [Bacteroidota bacterium]
MKKKGLLIIWFSLLTFLSRPCVAQSAQVDSLNKWAYEGYRKDVNASKSWAYQALKLAEQNQLGPQMVDSYINLSRCFRTEGNWDSAFQVLNIAVVLAEKNRYEKGLMNAYNNLAACHLMQGDTELAEPKLKKSLQYAVAVDDPKGQANAYNNLAIIAEANLEYDSAMAYLDGALAVYYQILDSSGIARIYLNQAFIFESQNKIDSAIHYCFQALRIQEARKLSYQQANTLLQIADLYETQSDYEKTLNNQQQALSIFSQIGDVTGISSANINIGNTLQSLDRYREALPYTEQGLEYARKTADPFMIGTSLINVTNVYTELGYESDTIRNLLYEAIPLLEGNENLSAAYAGLGYLALSKKQYADAKSWYKKELEVAEDFEILSRQKSALEHLYSTYKANGETAKALELLERYSSVHDSLLNLETIETINQLNIEYESEKKEKENLILQNDLTQSKLEASEQKALRNLLLGIAAVVLLLGAGGFIWYRYRQRIALKEQALELEQERARKEQKRKEAEKLKELDAMKTRFFTNISHEFRTPLTLILGQNEQLQAAIEDKKLQNRLTMVGRNGHRLLDLINQVLDVAKLEAGGMSLEPSRLETISYFKHIFYSFESLAEEKGISLAFQSNLESLETAFDVKKMERVIFNLLSNAIKFTGEGGKIEMSVLRSSNQLHITISDTGQGIKTEQLPYIFDRFYQADSNENQAKPGTGIGLSLVKELVELHEGQIKVKSELQQGTTFEIRIPLVKDLAEYELRQVATALSPAALPNNTLAVEGEGVLNEQQEQILLIEDNPDVRAFVREQLLDFGYQVHTAEDGREGVEAALDIIPDLIISDIMMPRLDGYGVAKALKHDPKTSHIPLILLTSKASEDSKIEGLEQGVDDYLLKPFNSRELKVRISNLIQQRRRLRERFSTATIIRPNEVSAVPIEQTFIKKVLEIIETNLSNEQFSVEVLSEELGMSVNNLNRKLRALIDQTAGKLIRSMRLQRAADLLQQKAVSISDIAYDMGFSSPNHFARSFKKQFGVSPSEFVNQS